MSASPHSSCSFRPAGGSCSAPSGNIIWIGFSLYVAWIGLACIEEGLYYPEVSPTLGVVKAWVECIIPFSFVLVSWRIVEEYVVRWRNGTLGELVRYEEAA